MKRTHDKSPNTTMIKLYEDMSSRSSSRIVKQIKKDKNIFIHDYDSFVIDSSFTIYQLLLLANGVTL